MLVHDLSRRVSWTVPVSAVMRPVEEWPSPYPAFDIHISGKSRADMIFVLERLQDEVELMALQLKNQEPRVLDSA